MSCGSWEQSSGSSSTNSAGVLSTSSSSMESAFSFSQAMEGYDYDFVARPEARYECPICLLILREPRQTRCGHRFCRDCIMRSLRDSSERCPVDNEPLKEEDIYPDNFAKREILNFDIHCPNNKEGCENIFPLGKLQNHLDECLYALVPCPNKCASILQRKDVEVHLTQVCENRMLTCDSCHVTVPAKLRQVHITVCPRALVLCPYCKEQRGRNELNEHVQTECHFVEVPCPFNLLGCNQRVRRSLLDEHLAAHSTSHMTQLCQAVTDISQRLGLTYLSDASPPSSLPEACISRSQFMNSTSYVDRPSLSERSCFSFDNSMSLSADSTNTPQTQVQHVVLDHVNGCPESQAEINHTNPPTKNGVDGSHRITIARYQSFDSSRCQISPAPNSSGRDNQTYLTSLPTAPKPKLPVRRLHYQQVYSTPGNELGFSTANPNSSSHRASLLDFNSEVNGNVVSMLQQMNDQFEQKEAVQNQQLQDLYQKCAALEQLNITLAKKVKDLEEQVAERDSRIFNGEYYWSINNFSHYHTKLMAGESTTLHSPAFYTSPWGYKLCVRATIENSPNGEPHLSLFVHFMKGKNDSFLVWPFPGKICICVMDQKPEVNRRLHLKETLTASPTLAAFQRPASFRNHKGFGYVNFLSMTALEKGTFLAEDTLVIRVQAFVDLK